MCAWLFLLSRSGSQSSWAPPSFTRVCSFFFVNNLFSENKSRNQSAELPLSLAYVASIWKLNLFPNPPVCDLYTIIVSSTAGLYLLIIDATITWWTNFTFCVEHQESSFQTCLVSLVCMPCKLYLLFQGNKIERGGILDRRLGPGASLLLNVVTHTPSSSSSSSSSS